MKHGKKFFVGGLINVGAGLGELGYGIYQERQAKKKMAQADELSKGPIRTQAARERIAEQETDAQSAVDAALRAQATAAEQLGQTGGSRALVSATPGLMRATDIASQGAIEQFGTQGAALKKQEEAIQNLQQNIGAQNNLDRLAEIAGLGRQTAIGGVTNIIKGGAEIAGSIEKKDPTDTEDPSSPSGDGGSITYDPMEEFEGELKREKGGVQKNLKEEIEKTPGEFSHDTNPIDIVQEGAKIGEMTGGEYIFNPDQAEKLLELSKEGDTELHKFLRNLLNKEQFK